MMAKLTELLVNPVFETLGLTLLHFVWQGAALTLVLAVILFLLKGARATTRYRLSFSSFIVLSIIPLATFSYLYPASSQRNIPESSPLKLTQSPLISNSLTPSTSTSDQQEASQAISLSRPPSIVITTTANLKAVAAYPNNLVNIASIKPYLPLLVAFWLIGVMILSLRMMGGLWLTYQLRFKSTKPIPKELEASFKTLLRQMNITKVVRLKESLLVSVPVVIGWLRPIILLPTSALTGLNTQQLEFILAHELAHVQRYDYLFNIFQKIVETLLFYHPAVWWLSHVIRQEREHCCDDVVLELTKGASLNYANTLSKLEQLRANNQFAIAATGGSLLNRIQRLAGKPSSNNPAEWLVGVILLLSLSLVFSLGSAQADLPVEFEQNIDAFMENRLETWEAPGAQVAVIQNGQIVFNKAYGLADLASSRAMTIDTPILLGPEGGFYFVMVAVHQLIEKGVLNFEDAVSEVLPWVAFKEGEESSITVANLRDGTANIIDIVYPKNIGTFQEVAKSGVTPPDLKTAEAYIRSLTAEQLQTATRRQSSFLINDSLLILMIEQLSGLSFEDYMKQNVFEPLGMQATYDFEEAQQLGLASLYENDRGTADPVVKTLDISIPKPFRPALGLSMSSKDMAKFVSAVIDRNPDILSEESWQLLTPLNSAIYTDSETGSYVRFGGTAGSETMMGAFPSLQTGYVVMMNYKTNQLPEFPSYALLQSIAVSIELLKETRIQRASEGAALTTASSFAIERFSGQYISSLGILKLFAKEDELHGSLLGHDFKINNASTVYVTSSDYEPIDKLILTFTDGLISISNRPFAFKLE